MAKIKKHKNRCTANGVPYAAKLARQRMIREAVQHAQAELDEMKRSGWISVDDRLPEPPKEDEA